MTHLAHIADRLLNTPLLITPDKARTVLQVLQGRLGVDAPDMNRLIGEQVSRDENGEVVSVRPYNVSEGVGIVSITGSLVARGAWVGASSGLTSYEGVQYQLGQARADPGVRSVILDIHSPGGEAVGAMETAGMVRQLAAEKPTTAVINGMAASAAYAVASGANEVVTTETGVSGSIGVVLLHVDWSRQLESEGVNPTLIYAGEHKVDANPLEPLSNAVKSDLQDQVDVYYDAFVRGVSAGRGERLTAQGARDTQARTYIGRRAVDAGLADRVSTFESVLERLSKRAPSGRARTSQQRRASMSEETGAPAAETAGHTQAELDEAHARGADAERARIQAIVADEAVKGDAQRMSAGLDLAAKSPGMCAEDVVAFVTANVAQKGAGTDMSLAARDAAPDSLAAAGVGQEPVQRQAGQAIKPGQIFQSRRAALTEET